MTKDDRIAMHVAAVEEYHGFDLAEMRGPRRPRDLCEARAELYFRLIILERKTLNWTLDFMYRSTSSTALWYVRAESNRRFNTPMNATIQDIQRVYHQRKHGVPNEGIRTRHPERDAA